MSVVASPNGRPAHGIPAPGSKTAELLGHMKLRATSDPVVHQKISLWVAHQKAPTQIHPSKVVACRISSTLLLQRLVRAFENRLSSSLNGVKKTKVSKPNKLPKKLPALSVLMQRKVKVTQLVKQAVQFVGSDVLKVLQVANPSPTVADVANFCLTILNDENKIKEFYRIFSDASGKDPSTVDEPSSIFFGVFALQALQSLRAQAISTYEFSHDFEMIYRACYQDDNFQICMHELNPVMNAFEPMGSASFAPDTEARNICWKLARLLALKYDHQNKSNPEAKDHRRNHIMLSATSIIIAANIGKSVKNGEITNAIVSEQKGIIPDSEDFVALVATPVSGLLNFLAKNTSQNQGITPISNADIYSHVMETCKMISYLGIGQRVTSGMASSNSKSLLAKAFSPSNHQILVRDYQNIIKTLVTETQKYLKVNVTNQAAGELVSVRTGIVDVLLFFPMVIGEPWGIHRDAPMITSKMLCLGEHLKPSDPLKDSVAVVMKMHPRPKVVKRKVASTIPNIPDSIQTANKKAKIISLIESPKKIQKKTSQKPIHIEKDASTLSTPRTPINLKRGRIEAPFIDDSSELNEWTLSILSLSVIKPTDTLLTYLGEIDRTQGDGASCLQDVIVPALNRGALRIQSAIRSTSNLNSETMATKLSVGRRDGQVYVNGAVDKNIQLCASIVGFYYYSLEAIIQDQMERMDFLGSFGSQLQSRPFHRALLACCYSSILKGVGMNQKLRMKGTNEKISVQVLLDCTESDPYTFLKVVEAFSRAVTATKEATLPQNGSPIVAGLPVILYKHVQKIEAQLIDSVLWSMPMTSEASVPLSFSRAIKTMKSLPGAWPPDILEPMLPEEIVDLESDSSKNTEVRYKASFGSSSEANFLSFVLRKLLKFTFFRIRAMCAALDLSNEGGLHTQILVAFRYLLRRHISVFSDRHVDQLLMCTIYGVCRVMKIKPVISFGKVIDAYFSVRAQDQGDRACRIIVRHVKLDSAGKGSRSNSQVVGNIVVFYNTVYIPKMQKYFLGSKSLKETTALYQQTCGKEGMLDNNDTSEKKVPADTAPDKSSNSTTDAVFAGNSTVATQTSQSTSSMARSAAVGQGEKNISQNDSLDASSEKGNFIAVDLENKPTSLNSAKEYPGTSGVSHMVAKSVEISESNPISSPSVTKNRKMNGQILPGTNIADSKSEVGTKLDPAVVVEENSASGIANNGPKVSKPDLSEGPSKVSTSSIEKVGSPDDKPKQQVNGTKISGSLIDHNSKNVVLGPIAAKVNSRRDKKSVEPNKTVRTEGNFDGSQDSGPQTTGDTATTAICTSIASGTTTTSTSSTNETAESS